MKRRIICFLLVFMLFFTSVSYAVDISIDGQKVEFTNQSGAPFVDSNNRTQVPLRVTMESFGANVGWDNNTRIATVEKDDIRVEVPIGQTYIFKNGEKITNDTAAIIKDSKTYLPIRAVLEAFDATVGWDNETQTVTVNKGTYVPTTEQNDIFQDYTIIQVDGDDTSGYREPNVAVDVGYGYREYWAFTNEYGQLVRVIADEIILQDETNEDVNSDGRYYSQMANVPGVGADTGYDRGHVIADSLGGVANAYNITPQEATLNRHGDQAYMEAVIRSAGGCSDFEAIITYPNTETQIPSHYKYTYTLMGNVIVDEFDNINPDEYNQSIGLYDNTNDNSNQYDNVEEDITGVRYILNTNSKKIHYPDCSSVGRMSEKNKKETNLYRDELISQGYDPCGICKP